MRVARGDAAILADHQPAILHRDAVSLGEDIRSIERILADHFDPFKDTLDQLLDQIGVVFDEVVPHGEDVGDAPVRTLRADDQARAGIHAGDRVDIRRESDEGIKALVLDKELRGRWGVGGPFEIDVVRIDLRVQEQGHDEEVARGVLRHDDFFLHAVDRAQVVDVFYIVARDNAVAASRVIDLHRHVRDRPAVLRQFRGEERDHVERGPHDRRLSARVEVTVFHRVVHHGELHVKPVLGKDAVVIRLHAAVGDDDRCPPRPHVDREQDDRLPVFCFELVAARALDGRDDALADQFDALVRREQLAGDSLNVGELLFDNVFLLLRAGRCAGTKACRWCRGGDLVAPAPDARADECEDDDGKGQFAFGCHGVFFFGCLIGFRRGGLAFRDFLAFGRF